MPAGGLSRDGETEVVQHSCDRTAECEDAVAVLRDMHRFCGSTSWPGFGGPSIANRTGEPILARSCANEAKNGLRFLMGKQFLRLYLAFLPKVRALSAFAQATDLKQGAESSAGAWKMSPQRA